MPSPLLFKLPPSQFGPLRAREFLLTIACIGGSAYGMQHSGVTAPCAQKGTSNVPLIVEPPLGV